MISFKVPVSSSLVMVGRRAIFFSHRAGWLVVRQKQVNQCDTLNIFDDTASTGAAEAQAPREGFNGAIQFSAT